MKTERDSMVNVGWNKNTIQTIETMMDLFRSKLFLSETREMMYLSHTRLKVMAAIKMTGSNKYRNNLNNEFVGAKALIS